MSAASDSIKAAIELANESYSSGQKEGYLTGYKEGFNAGLDAAKRLVAGDDPEKIISDLKK